MAGNPTSPEEIRRIFNDDIRPYYFPNTQTPATRPAIVLVGGQPASGKSSSTSRIIKERPGLVPLSGDDLRSFHPDYERLMKADPLTAGKPLSEATAVWVRNAIEYARDHQHSLKSHTNRSSTRPPRRGGLVIAPPRPRSTQQSRPSTHRSGCASSRGR